MRASRPLDLGARAGSMGPFVPPIPSRPFSPSIQVRGSGDFRAGIPRLLMGRQLNVRSDYLRGLLDGLGIEPAKVRQLPVLSPEQFEVVKLYAQTAILLPTLSDRVRHTQAEIRDYFVHFLTHNPKAKIDEANVRVLGGIAINSGVYTFRFTSGPLKSIQARFTFVYQWVGDRWLVIEHHSSGMPEQCKEWCDAAAGPIVAERSRRPRTRT
jgi:hypothetical protein